MNQNVILPIIAAIGGEEFNKVGTVKPYLFTPNVLGFLKSPAYGVRIEVGIKKAIMLIIYDEGADLYIVYAGKNCKNVGKKYDGIYYDRLLTIIELEADQKFPNLKCPEFEIEIKDFEI